MLVEVGTIVKQPMGGSAQARAKLPLAGFPTEVSWPRNSIQALGGGSLRRQTSLAPAQRPAVRPRSTETSGERLTPP